MSKRFLVILAACIVVFAGLLFFTKRDSNSTGNTGGNGNSSATLTEHKVGKGTTGVTLVEYGDFQCSACYQYYPILKQIKEKYGDQITFQYRHYPLTEIHQNALISARAAEAAGKQGKFFEMHDRLYEGQPTWSSSTNPTQIFEDYATQLALNLDQFRTDMKSEAANDAIQADRGEARRLGFSSTPTFELNGKKIESSPRSLDEFSKLIDDAIKEKQAQ